MIKKKKMDRLLLPLLFGSSFYTIFSATGIASAMAPVGPGDYTYSSDTAIEITDSILTALTGIGDYTFDAAGHTLTFSGIANTNGVVVNLVDLSNGSTAIITADDIVISDATHTLSNDNDLRGLRVESNSSATMNGNLTVQNIKSTSSSSYGYTEGIQLGAGSALEVNGSLLVDAISSVNGNAIGVSVDNTGTGSSSGDLIVTGATEIKNITAAKEATALEVVENGGATFSDDLKIENIESSAENARGIISGIGGQIHVEGNTSIDSIDGAADAIALIVYDSSTVTLDKDLNISSVTSANQQGIGVSVGSLGSDLTVGGNAQIDAIEGQSAIGFTLASGAVAAIDGDLGISNVIGLSDIAQGLGVSGTGGSDITDLHVKGNTQIQSITGDQLTSGLSVGNSASGALDKNLMVSEITSTNGQANGVQVSYLGELTVGGDAKIASVSGKQDTSGLLVSEDGALEITGDAVTSTITSSDGKAFGVNFNNAWDVEAKIDGNVLIESISGKLDSFGMNLSQGTSLEIGKNTEIHNITSSDGEAFGINFADAWGVEAKFGENVLIDSIRGKQDSFGVSLSEGTSLEISKTIMISNVASSDGEAAGMISESWGSSVNIGENLLIDAISGDQNATGLRLISGTEVSVDESIYIKDIDASNGRAAGVTAEIYGSTLTTGKDLIIESVNSGGEAFGIYTNGADEVVTIGGDGLIRSITGVQDTTGILADNQSAVDFQNLTVDSVSSSSGKAVALHANHGGEINISKGLVIQNITGPDALAIHSEGADSLVSANSSGGNLVSILGNALADNQGEIQVVMDTQASQWIGDLQAGNAGQIDVSLQDGLFMGTANQGTGSIQINMAGDSRWQMTDSWNADLTMSGGHLFFADNAPKTIAADGNVTMNGANLHFDVDLGNQIGDKLVVNNGISGSGGNVFVTSNGTAKTNGTEKLDLIIDSNYSGAQFNMADEVEAGGYSYGLHSEQRSGNAQAWYLGVTGAISNTADAGVNVFRASYLLNYADQQTLMQRMGDLRQGAKSNSIWVRPYGGSFSANKDGKLSGFDLDYWGIQGGYDKQIKLKNPEHNLYVGAMVGHSEGNLDLRSRGKGDIESNTLGVYGTFVHKNGFYSDLVLRYGWYERDFNTPGSSKHGIDSQGWSASLEIGKRHFIDPKKQEGWYVEPQTQWTIGKQSGDSYTASNGLYVNVSDMTTFTGRIGANIGYEVKEGKRPINAYLKFNIEKEFDGDFSYRLNGSKESGSYGGTRLIWGAGITSQLNQNHNVYFEIEKSSGDEFSKEWGINAGYRFSW